MAEDTKISVFDRLLGRLEGLPDVVNTRPTVVRYTEPLVGEVQTYTIQTWRVREQGDHVFIEYVSGNEAHRFYLPPKVTAVLNRQRDALSKKNARAGARKAVETRKQLGIVPNFTKKQADEIVASRERRRE